MVLDQQECTMPRCYQTTGVSTPLALPACLQVLCASNDAHDQVDPVIVPEGAALGERVKVEGFDGEPLAEVNPKKKILEKLFPDMKTDASEWRLCGGCMPAAGVLWRDVCLLLGCCGLVYGLHVSVSLSLALTIQACLTCGALG
jgi:hypothetical protein